MLAVVAVCSAKFYIVSERERERENKFFYFKLNIPRDVREMTHDGSSERYQSITSGII
jgi:hypothetical protein